MSLISELNNWAEEENIVADSNQALVFSHGNATAGLEGMVQQTLPLDPSFQYDENKQYISHNLTVQRREDGTNHFTAFINDVIGSASEYAFIIDALCVASPQDRFDIQISSPGGNLWTGTLISHLIKKCRCEVHGYAVGMCASAASLIWSACHHCHIVAPYAMYMYHMSSHCDWDDSHKVAKYALAQVAYVREILRDALDKKHITKDEYDAICDKSATVWIPGEEMLRRLRGEEPQPFVLDKFYKETIANESLDSGDPALMEVGCESFIDGNTPEFTDEDLIKTGRSTGYKAMRKPKLSGQPKEAPSDRNVIVADHEGKRVVVILADPYILFDTKEFSNFMRKLYAIDRTYKVEFIFALPIGTVFACTMMSYVYQFLQTRENTTVSCIAAMGIAEYLALAIGGNVEVTDFNAVKFEISEYVLRDPIMRYMIEEYLKIFKSTGLLTDEEISRLLKLEGMVSLSIEETSRRLASRKSLITTLE